MIGGGGVGYRCGLPASLREMLTQTCVCITHTPTKWAGGGLRRLQGQQQQPAVHGGRQGRGQVPHRGEGLRGQGRRHREFFLSLLVFCLCVLLAVVEIRAPARTMLEVGGLDF